MNKPHILVIPSWYAYAEGEAAGVYFREQIFALKRAGYTVGVVAPVFFDLVNFVHAIVNFKWSKRPLFGKNVAIENNVPVFRWHCLNFLTFRIPLLRKLNVFLVKKNLAQLIELYIEKHGMPDLIHAHCIFWGGYAAKNASVKYQIPFIVTEHSSNYGRRKIHSWRIPFLFSVLKRASGFFTVSDSLGANIQNTGKINYEVISNVVDTDFFKLGPQKTHVDVKRFLAIAELKTYKGLHLLIQAFAQAFKGQEHIILEIGGEGREENNLKKLVHKLGMEKQIKFLGVLSRSQVRDALYRADAFVLPSDYETFGVVFIEAMATGLPVIASRSGGPVEIIKNDELGILINPGQIVEIKEALIRILNNISMGLYNAEKIRCYIIKNYSYEVVVEKLSRVYQQVLGGSQLKKIVADG